MQNTVKSFKHKYIHFVLLIWDKRIRRQEIYLKTYF